MATTATTPTAVPAVKRDTWGTTSYLFMRLSGLLLIFLVIGHFLIQHVINDVHNLSLEFVQQRWMTLGWRAYDAFLLALALIHGLNGTRFVINDYILNPRWNLVLKILLFLIGAVLIVIGSAALIGGARSLP